MQRTIKHVWGKMAPYMLCEKEIHKYFAEFFVRAYHLKKKKNPVEPRILKNHLTRWEEVTKCQKNS